MLDLIIRGGQVIDGSGSPGFMADVGLDGDRIAAVGDMSELRATRELDAHGRVVTPGFIDIHSHSDFTLLVDPRARSSIVQGVTTEIVGNCGHGCGPVMDLDLLRTNIYGYSPAVDIDWQDLGGYLERLDGARPAVNVATLVPNGNLRLAVVGLEERPADEHEIRRMASLLEQGLEEGAFGFSTGLEYPAERACSGEELTALCTVAARHGTFYATHVRNRDLRAVQAIEEAVAVAAKADIALEVSHIIPRRARHEDAWVRALEVVDEARARGQDVTFDAHTRTHSTTNLSMILPPPELTMEGEQLIERLEDPAVRARIKRYPSIVTSWGLGGWNHVSLFSARCCPERIGRNMEELAPPGGDGVDAVLDILAASADHPHDPMGVCEVHDELWLRDTMIHPSCLIGSDATALAPDGPLADSTFLGAYTWAAWFVRRLVREWEVLSLEEAVHRLTQLPAERVGLERRGRLAEGYKADLAVFDRERFADRGTLASPNRLAEGMSHVIVNGVISMENGAFTGERGGQVLRS